MSSLWTPGGERPVGRPTEPSPDDAGEPLHEEEVAARIEAMRGELLDAPVEIVVANHCYGLFELAAVYLSQQPPLLARAQLAIDALGLLVDGLAGRLGDAESGLRDGLSQLRLAYVQIEGAQRTGVDATSGAGANGGSAGAGPTSGAGANGGSAGAGPTSDAGPTPATTPSSSSSSEPQTPEE